jgi:Fur family transcriptional regulator, ferric uptake regulator
MTDGPVVGTTRTAQQGRDGFLAYLREHNLPVTAQRLAIAEVLIGSAQHLSAEEIAQALAARGEKAGTATVYRTLDLLVRSGLVVERDFGEGFRRFEAARDVPHHEHLLCTVCGSVTEFRDERLERMTTIIAEAHDFARQRHRLVIQGMCGSCRRGERATRTESGSPPS